MCGKDDIIGPEADGLAGWLAANGGKEKDMLHNSHE